VKETPAPAIRPPRRTQAERSTDTQERILAAATEVMREHGYAGLRVADVTVAAGMSRGAQTHHFPSKVELVQAIFARLFEQASHDSLARASAVARGDDVIAALIEDGSAFFLGQDFTLGLDMLAAAGRDPELREAVQGSARLNRFAVEGMWTQVLESHGLSRADADDVLWLAFSTIRGLSVRLLWDYDPERFERVKKLAYDAARALYDSKRTAA
jgi:AcrR family transcriptional regulator